jgi:hypothetical protein
MASSRVAGCADPALPAVMGDVVEIEGVMAPQGGDVVEEVDEVEAREAGAAALVTEVEVTKLTGVAVDVEIELVFNCINKHI